MKHDLTKATFIIPVRIESQDRMRNVIASTIFLLQNFDTKIIIKEVDDASVYEKFIAPQIREYLGDSYKNLSHFFQYSVEPLFHRQRILNEMVMASNTEIVVNYDCDVILPIESYLQAYNSILDGENDVVYPYGQGMYQRQVSPEDAVVNEFLEDFDFDVLDRNSKEHTSDYGWAQFFRKEVYINGGLENENFRAYAPEDLERFYRFQTLGYNVGRVNNTVYHLEHARGENSWFNNPHMENNTQEWEKIKVMSKEELIEYYSRQEYLKKYDVIIQPHR